jgi:hypothetical protein
MPSETYALPEGIIVRDNIVSRQVDIIRTP